MVEFEILAGIDERFIDRRAWECGVHRGLLEPLAALRERARQSGFDLALASGFRNFERQLAIWNQKARGQRPVLDDEGEPLPVEALSEEERLWAILRWSALPGASRHHWGTDVDVYDAAPCRQGYRLQLTREETCDGGIFTAFHEWLSGDLTRPESGFFRPYVRWEGGVAPEPWHLSFAPLARQCQAALDPIALRRHLAARQDLALRELVLKNFDEIYERFVWVDWGLYPPD